MTQGFVQAGFFAVYRRFFAAPQDALYGSTRRACGASL
jgi:hypothetical protein